MGDSQEAKLARIDENVKQLLKALPVIQQLKTESEINKKEHKWALGLGGTVVSVLTYWLFK